MLKDFAKNIEKEKTYFPVTLPETVRQFVIAATTKKMAIKQMDVSLAYLHLTLDEPIYVSPPKGIEVLDYSKVWKCNKALYGLRNAGRASYLTFLSSR